MKLKHIQISIQRKNHMNYSVSRVTFIFQKKKKTRHESDVTVLNKVFGIMS